MDNIKIRYSIEPKDRIYVKAYGFLSFAKNIGKNISNKYRCNKMQQMQQKQLQKSNSKNGRRNRRFNWQ